MNIQELLKKNTFEDIWERYKTFQSIPEEKKSFFEKAYHLLSNKTIEPPDVPSSIFIEIKQEEHGPVYDALLRHDDESQKVFALDFINWGKIAGYTADIQGLDESLYIMETLYGITFDGLEEDMISYRDNLVNRIQSTNADKE